MVETFTIDFVSVADGDVTPFTPQELVQQNALIDIVSAEAQWRGVSEVEFNTESGSNENSDSASAFIDVDRKNNSASSSGKTTGTVTTDSTTKRDSRSGSTSERGSNSLSVSAPSDPRSKYPNATVEPVSIEADYYVDEDSGGTDRGVEVEWDDDPYNAANYDSRTRLTISGNSRQRVGGFSSSIQSWSQYRSFDGAQIRYIDRGSPFGTNSLEAEITLTYRVTTREQEINRENVSVVYPSTPSGTNFDYHRIVTFVDGEYDGSEYIYSNKSGQVYSETTPASAGSTKRIQIITRGTERNTVSQAATVSYPDVADTFSFDRHEITVVDNGETVTDETVFENRIGETISRTSSKPTEPVSIRIKTFFSKTIQNTLRTTNPSVEGDFLPERINTDKICFLFDTSSSVNQPSQKDIGRRIVSRLGDTTNISVVEFDYDATEQVPLGPLGSNRSAALDSINSLDTSGGTDMGVGLTAGSESLGGSDGTIVLISDGEAGDVPIPVAESIGNENIQVVTIQVGDGETETLDRIATVTNGVFFDGSVDTELFGTVLNDNELSQWKELTGVTRDEQVFTHSIEGSGLAEFRFRFDWEYLTPEPTLGTTGLYDDSAGVWREVAVADEEDSALQYTHVQVFNDEQDEWGALDVVDLSNENAIDAFQFYDEDEGWLAPRQFNTV